MDALLADDEGDLVADAHVVYDPLYADGQIVEVVCWAHQRRYLLQTLASEPERAREGLAIIGELFQTERTVATAPPACSGRGSAGACPSASTGVARRGGGLVLDDGRLPLEHNASERQLREVIGRCNWLLVGSDDAAEVKTPFVSNSDFVRRSCASAILRLMTDWRAILIGSKMAKSWTSKQLVLALAVSCGLLGLVLKLSGMPGFGKSAAPAAPHGPSSAGRDVSGPIGSRGEPAQVASGAGERSNEGGVRWGPQTP